MSHNETIISVSPPSSPPFSPATPSFSPPPSFGGVMAVDETADIEQYDVLMRGSPYKMMRFYQENDDVVLFKPLSSNMDTPFHVAAFFGDTNLLAALLRLAAKFSFDDFEITSEMVCEIKNNFGNNLLHEVAATGKVEVLELLMKKIEFPSSPEQMENPINGGEMKKKVAYRAFLENDQIKDLIGKKNADGETPIFKASALAGVKMLQSMIKLDNNNDIYNYHLYNGSRKTILQMTILSQHFESAIWLLEEKEYLQKIKYEEMKEDTVECLRLLATMPRAFKSGYHMGIWHTIIYMLLPVEIMEKACQWHGIYIWIHYVFWLCIGRIVPPVKKMWKKKKTHYQAKKVLTLILKNKSAWTSVFNPPASGGNPNRSQISSDDDKNDSDINDYKNPRKEEKITLDKNKLNPLLLAASNGIIEMVGGILDEHPMAIENSDEKGWSLLHVAVAFRRAGVFRLLTEKWRRPVRRLAARVVEECEYTVLHQAGDTFLCANSETGLQFGPALQLQEEWRWYEDVEDITPTTMRFNRNKNKLTAKELFTNTHKAVHESAKTWLKDTAQSCSTVAVLIAGVAFAGACTVPGYYDNSGDPTLRRAALYKIFTGADVAALISSLISVVVFLSILTSPLPMASFGHTLPRKLLWGLAALFVSVASTMLAFMAAGLLVLGLKHKFWTSSFAYALAVLPMAIFGIIDFPMVYAYEKLVKPAAVKLVKKTVFVADSFPDRFQEFVIKCTRPFKKKIV